LDIKTFSSLEFSTHCTNSRSKSKNDEIDVLCSGSFAPVAEMQARWATGVLTGRILLPSEMAMRNEVEERHSWNAKQVCPRFIYYKMATHY
jgi:hypothetical protein